LRLASRGGIGFLERQAFRLYRLRKRLHQRLTYAPGQEKTVVFIVGCQRSGTSMLHHLLRQDRETVTYDELSPLSTRDAAAGLRWKPLPEVRQRILADRSPLVVTKPLVESQRLAELLDLFPSTRGIWMYRHFADVAVSNVKHFPAGTGLRDLRPIVDDDRTNWRAENLDPAAARVVRDLYREDLGPHDVAALFWYARNSLFFSCG